MLDILRMCQEIFSAWYIYLRASGSMQNHHSPLIWKKYDLDIWHWQMTLILAPKKRPYHKAKVICWGRVKNQSQYLIRKNTNFFSKKDHSRGIHVSQIHLVTACKFSACPTTINSFLTDDDTRSFCGQYRSVSDCKKMCCLIFGLHYSLFYSNFTVSLSWSRTITVAIGKKDRLFIQ